MAVWLNLIPQLHQPGDDDVSMRHHHFHEREPHYYAGAVRAESFTRLPPPLHPASMTDHHSIGAGTECVPNTTTEEDSDNTDTISDDIEDEEEGELLQRLATRHYYSYTAALGVTVGVGCLLLVLNMLIFAGIYYQRDRDRRRQDQSRNSRSNSAPSAESIPMSQRPNTPCGSLRHSPVLNRKEKQEFPPSYTLVSSDVQNNEHKKNKTLKPQPPIRTSSNPPGGTVKKRVQIQEISV
ncbi:neuroligin [Holotrichia oblita]|uniref:Neuroligin n=1 Tax=Holotrichia oblita TaxID=644536 RepID=A0ACB9TFJ1_HOLOL|nr:neuroligin [Holotrichia oblita]